MEMLGYTFANPWYLILMVLIPLMLAWYIFKHNSNSASIQVSNIKGLENAPITFRHVLRHMLFVFRLIAIALVIIVIARPQTTEKSKEVTTEGIDIVLALDISTSMLAEDFKPNRLEAAKDVAWDFVAERKSDRIGLVVFSGESFTQCPLTTDHSVIKNLFKGIRSGLIEDGTAIGLGLSNAVNRLKDSETMSKVVILLTDGVNNMGEIAPVTAAEIAKTFGIRVYTIGVGTLGKAPYPFQTAFGIQYQNIDVEIDETTLKEIATITDGKYFRATDNNKLKDIYREIDEMEKSRIEVIEYTNDIDEFFWFALAALLIFLTELILRYTLANTVP